MIFAFLSADFITKQILSYNICWCIHQLIHIQYLLRVCFVPGILLGPHNITMNKKSPSLFLKNTLQFLCCLIFHKFVYKMKYHLSDIIY